MPPIMRIGRSVCCELSGTNCVCSAFELSSSTENRPIAIRAITIRKHLPSEVTIRTTRTNGELLFVVECMIGREANELYLAVGRPLLGNYMFSEKCFCKVSCASSRHF
jgi:hypothetical protein